MRRISNAHANAPVARHPFHLGFKSLLTLWVRNQETRKSLKDMEAHRLDDIGVDRGQAEVEGRKPFWR